MKIRIDYRDSVQVDIDPEDIADRIPEHASDEQIEKLIREDIADAASEASWPTFSVERWQVEEALNAVKKALTAAVEADREER